MVSMVFFNFMITKFGTWGMFQRVFSLVFYKVDKVGIIVTS